MSVIKLDFERRKIPGIWHIQDMSEWDRDYLNMEVQAFIRIDKNARGEFQFGLVTGIMFGSFEKFENDQIFKFIWEGSDEGESVSGNGWIRALDDEKAEGEIRFHSGEKSFLVAEKVK